MRRLCLLFLLGVGCQNAASEAEQWAALETQTEPSIELAERYWRFAQTFPRSPNAPKAALKSARLLDANGLTRQAIDRYAEVERAFPQGAEAAQACFLVGFAYANALRDTAAARQAFERFLARYPESELAPSARFELATLGKSLDEAFNPDSLASQ